MLKDTVVVTFSSTDIHREYQKEFDKLYGSRFLAHVDWDTSMIKGTEYYNNHMSLFRYKKYFGYFLWKPYIILDAMQTFPNNAILYCDSNVRFKDIDGFEPRFDYWLKRQFLFIPKHDHYYNYEWTKRDTFVYMDADYEDFWYAKQRWSVLFGVSPSPGFSKRFMQSYQQYCEISPVVTEVDNISGLDNLPGFREHRWEQSVLSILAERYGIDGPTDVEMLKYYDKIYTPEHMEFKEEINENISELPSA